MIFIKTWLKSINHRRAVRISRHPTKSLIFYLQLFYVKEGPKLGAFSNVKFGKNMAKVGFDGTFLNEHGFGNFPVGTTLRGKSGDLHLLLGQVV